MGLPFLHLLIMAPLARKYSDLVVLYAIMHLYEYDINTMLWDNVENIATLF
jgi:hypothetical protein